MRRARVAGGDARRASHSLLLAESLLLALPAALLRLPVALLTLRVLAKRYPGRCARRFRRFEPRRCGVVAIGVAVASALAFGLFPVRRPDTHGTGKRLQANGSRQTIGTKASCAFAAPCDRAESRYRWRCSR